MSLQTLQNSNSAEAFDEGQQFCAGCHRSVNSETGSVVVAFGNSLWHVDCFRCAKCGDLVNAETPSLLLLSDGSPVCAKCYSCKICNKAILDEAVMAGEDSYHASCFKCRTCHRRIDELVFAKTSQGLYCMNCHNERVARHRKQAAIRKQKERDRQAQTQGSSNSRSSAGSGSGHGHVAGNDSPSSVQKSSGYATPPSSSEGPSPSHNHVHRSGSAASASQSGSSMTTDDRPGGSGSKSTHSTPGGAESSRQPSPISQRNSTDPSHGRALSPSQNTSLGRDQTSLDDAKSKSFENHQSSGSSIDIAPLAYSLSVSESRSDSGSSSARHSSSSHISNHSFKDGSSTNLSNPHEQNLALTRTNSAGEASVKSFDTSVTLKPETVRAGPNGFNNATSGPNPLADDGPRQKAVDFDQTRKKSLDDGTRPLYALFRDESSTNAKIKESGSSLSVPGGTSRSQKRRSINPGLQLNYSDIQRMRPPSPSTSSSSVSSTPGDSKDLNISTSSAPSSRDSPRTPSPLREYFIVDGRQTPDREKSSKRSSGMSGATAFYSVTTSPQPTEDKFSLSRSASPGNAPSPHSAPPNQQLFSSSVYATPPQRMESLRSGSGPEISQSNHLTPEQSLQHDSSRVRRASPSDKLFDSRENNGIKPLGSPLRGNFMNKGSITLDKPGSRNRSGSETTLDVPHSIESGTDTETEVDIELDRPQENVSPESSSSPHPDVPPTPPPKEYMLDQSYLEQNSSKESIVEHEIGNDSSEAGSTEVSSPVQQRRSIFFTPALPPIRFSMDQTDFSEIWKKVNGSNQAVSPIVEEQSPAISPTLEKSAMVDSKSESQDVLVPAQDETLPKTPRPTESSIFNVETNGETPKASKRGNRKAAPEALDLSQPNASATNDQVPPVSPPPVLLPELPIKSPRRQEISPPAERSASPPEATTVTGVSGPTTPVRDGSGRGSPNIFVTQQISKNDLQARERRPSKSSLKSSARPSSAKSGNVDFVGRRLKEVYNLSKEKKRDFIKLEPEFVEAILNAMEESTEQYMQLTNKVDSMKRASQRMIDGLSVAQEEYDAQVSARREAEAEVTRLKVEMAGQAAKLTALSSDDRRRELQQQLSQELVQNLSGLEKDVSQLKVERDMALAEMEELNTSKEDTAAPTNDSKANKLSRSLTGRFDGLKKQYQKDLLPLTQQKEKLLREIVELKQERDIFLAETTVLNKRNEELAELNTQYERRLESSVSASEESEGSLQPGHKVGLQISPADSRQIAPPLSTTTSTSSSATLAEDISESRSTKVQKTETPDHTTGQVRSRGIGIRWPGYKNKDIGSSPGPENKKLKARLQHTFHQLNALRISRCDHCGEKLFGSQLRCSSCNISIHPRCVHHMQMPCVRDNATESAAAAGPSLFGRDLAEQVQADSKGDGRMVPIIVEKCIEAVETFGMDYEGIYRKTGGSSQSKLITQLFERGDYDSFNLQDSDLFNDISSVTSVLKNYFRSLPDPLLTYEFHESFVTAANIRDTAKKSTALTELVAKLPQEHYHTLCCLMLHLHRVQLQSDQNKMNARNLGVVFGPTLMRSPDPGREFADMAGKALSIEWLVENAPSVFSIALAVY